jgi:outer membrane protease
VYTSDPTDPTVFRDDIGSFPDGLLGITYEQNWAVPYLGLAASINAGSFRLAGSVIGSPLAYGSSDDDHWLRGVHFEDDFDRTNFVAASAEAAYLFGSNYQIFLNANGERYFRTGADTTMTGAEGNGEFEDGGGADHQNVQISLGFRVTN